MSFCHSHSRSEINTWINSRRRKLHDAMGDDALGDAGALIETMPGEGYRFVGSVKAG